MRKYTFVYLNNKALEDINKTKFLVNKIKEFGYDFKFKIHLKFGDKSYLSSIIPTMKKKHGIRILFKLSTSL